MIKIKQEVTYIENKTLTGEKIIVGIKRNNSYIVIKDEYREVFIKLFEKISLDNTFEEESFEGKEKELIKVFHKYGYLEGDEDIRKAFNEYNLLVKVFKQYVFPSIPLKEIKNKNMFYFFYILFLLVGLFILYKNWNYLQQPIKIEKFSITEIITCFTVIPLLIDISHEFGHLLVARCLGIRASNITIGFFVTWPTIYVRYEGLNLYSTKDKLCVISAGIAAHIFNVILGLALGMTKISDNIIAIWSIANIGMISTNLMFFGPSDGYFALTTVLGIYNLRYRGYKTLNCLLKSKFNQTYQDYLCALIVLGCWLWSFCGIYITLNYYGNIFKINHLFIVVSSVLIIILLFIRFIISIKKLGA